MPEPQMGSSSPQFAALDVFVKNIEFSGSFGPAATGLTAFALAIQTHLHEETSAALLLDLALKPRDVISLKLRKPFDFGVSAGKSILVNLQGEGADRPDDGRASSVSLSLVGAADGGAATSTSVLGIGYLSLERMITGMTGIDSEDSGWSPSVACERTLKISGLDGSALATVHLLMKMTAAAKGLNPLLQQHMAMQRHLFASQLKKGRGMANATLPGPVGDASGATRPTTVADAEGPKEDASDRESVENDENDAGEEHEPALFTPPALKLVKPRLSTAKAKTPLAAPSSRNEPAQSPPNEAEEAAVVVEEARELIASVDGLLARIMAQDRDARHRAISSPTTTATASAGGGTMARLRELELADAAAATQSAKGSQAAGSKEDPAMALSTGLRRLLLSLYEPLHRDRDSTAERDSEAERGKGLEGMLRTVNPSVLPTVEAAAAGVAPAAPPAPPTLAPAPMPPPPPPRPTAAAQLVPAEELPATSNETTPTTTSPAGADDDNEEAEAREEPPKGEESPRVPAPAVVARREAAFVTNNNEQQSPPPQGGMSLSGTIASRGAALSHDETPVAAAAATLRSLSSSSSSSSASASFAASSHNLAGSPTFKPATFYPHSQASAVGSAGNSASSAYSSLYAPAAATVGASGDSEGPVSSDTMRESALLSSSTSATAGPVTGVRLSRTMRMRLAALEEQKRLEAMRQQAEASAAERWSGVEAKKRLQRQQKELEKAKAAALAIEKSQLGGTSGRGSSAGVGTPGRGTTVHVGGLASASPASVRAPSSSTSTAISPRQLQEDLDSQRSAGVRTYDPARYNQQQQQQQQIQRRGQRQPNHAAAGGASATTDRSLSPPPPPASLPPASAATAQPTSGRSELSRYSVGTETEDGDLRYASAATSVPALPLANAAPVGAPESVPGTATATGTGSTTSSLLQAARSRLGLAPDLSLSAATAGAIASADLAFYKAAFAAAHMPMSPASASSTARPSDLTARSGIEDADDGNEGGPQPLRTSFSSTAGPGPLTSANGHTDVNGANLNGEGLASSSSVSSLVSSSFGVSAASSSLQTLQALVNDAVAASTTAAIATAAAAAANREGGNHHTGSFAATASAATAFSGPLDLSLSAASTSALLVGTGFAVSAPPSTSAGTAHAAVNGKPGNGSLRGGAGTSTATSLFSVSESSASISDEEIASALGAGKGVMAPPAAEEEQEKKGSGPSANVSLVSASALLLSTSDIDRTLESAGRQNMTAPEAGSASKARGGANATTTTPLGVTGATSNFFQLSGSESDILSFGSPEQQAASSAAKLQLLHQQRLAGGGAGGLGSTVKSLALSASPASLGDLTTASPAQAAAGGGDQAASAMHATGALDTTPLGVRLLGFSGATDTSRGSDDANNRTASSTGSGGATGGGCGKGVLAELSGLTSASERSAGSAGNLSSSSIASMSAGSGDGAASKPALNKSPDGDGKEQDSSQAELSQAELNITSPSASVSFLADSLGSKK